MSVQKNFLTSEVISYTPPKLYTGKKGNDWYIGFKAFDPLAGALRLKRIKLNHIEKISERRKYAADLITRLHNQLRIGWNPWISQNGNSKGLSLFPTFAIDTGATSTGFFPTGSFGKIPI